MHARVRSDGSISFDESGAPNASASDGGSASNRARAAARSNRTGAAAMLDTADGVAEHSDEAGEDALLPAHADDASRATRRLNTSAGGGARPALTKRGAPDDLGDLGGLAANQSNASSLDGLGRAAEGGAAEGDAHDDEDETAAFLRRVDSAVPKVRAAQGAAERTAGGAARLGNSSGGARDVRGNSSGAVAHRLWRVVPGGVSDIIEGAGDNMSVFTVNGLPPPPALNSTSYVSDPLGALSNHTKKMLEGNLSALVRLTSYRVVVLVLPRVPRETRARSLYGRNILRHWYGATKYYDRTSLLLLSTEGVAEVVVAPRCQQILHDQLSRHFSVKATELMQQPLSARRADDPLRSFTRLEECSLKLVFYVSFMIRSRSTLTAVSMRMLSMCMMLFMFATMTATRRQQARRFALYNEYRREMAYLSPGAIYQSRYEEDFFRDFEAGRLGMHREARQLGHTQMMLQMLALDQVIARLRHEEGRAYDDEFEEEGDFELEGEEDEAEEGVHSRGLDQEAVLSAFYAAETRPVCATQRGER